MTPIFSTETIAAFIDGLNSEPYFAKHPVSIEDYYNDCGVTISFYSATDYIECSVGVFGTIGEFNAGLEWLADLETGGDGSNRCIYVSKIPVRMKRKLAEYKKKIESILESYGLEVIGSLPNSSRGLVIPVMTEEYKKFLH